MTPAVLFVDLRVDSDAVADFSDLSLPFVLKT
jgi:hypothetical protein